jgi:hypothetical protein
MCDIVGEPDLHPKLKDNQPKPEAFNRPNVVLDLVDSRLTGLGIQDAPRLTFGQIPFGLDRVQGVLWPPVADVSRPGVFRAQPE